MRRITVLRWRHKKAKIDKLGEHFFTMGFDFSIQTVPLAICTESGKPFVFHCEKGNFVKRYIEEFVVPEEHRRFAFVCGRIYHLYTREVSNADSYSCSIQELLDVFPSWEDLKDEGLVVSWGWTEEDHYAFYRALLWFHAQKDIYVARWSY